ncbi:hypothetical protein ABT095_14040 [Kitasatospora sp. NPDC002227]|uniref:hypothetical protein n=1 Tax=Kitasatospora sp. NPDC002227 TaxID=3154773 RepID=UPI003332F8AC
MELARDRLASPQQIHAVKLTASSADPAHPAALAADGTTDRYWAPRLRAMPRASSCRPGSKGRSGCWTW